MLHCTAGDFRAARTAAVAPGDMLLHPNNLNAIHSLSESLVSLESDSQVVAYVWLCPETSGYSYEGLGRTSCYSKTGQKKSCIRWRACYNPASGFTLPLVNFFAKHPSIAQVNHRSIDPTAYIYKSLIRKDGGYGNVLGIILDHVSSAEHFYKVLDVCKGSSFGTNFTLAIPCVQLANLR